MDILARDDIKQLVDKREFPSISIYMPTVRAGRARQQSRINLKNLLREAKEKLVAQKVRGPSADSLLEPVQKLLDDGLFWKYQSEGLAVFIAEKVFRAYRLNSRLARLVVVGNRFHVKPLLPLLVGSERFYLLALSQSAVKFYEGDGSELVPVEIQDLPPNLAETTKLVQAERQVQFHTRTGAPGGRRSAAFHGQGAATEDTKERLTHYCRLIAQSVASFLNNEQAPLVLASVEFLAPIYAEVNSYPHLLAETIPGYPHRTNIKGLHERAMKIVRPHFESERKSAAARYRQLAGTGRTSNNLAEIVPASYHGRVEALFVAAGQQRWGTFDAKSGETVVHAQSKPGNEDLLNLAAMYTFLKRGQVFVVPAANVPDKTLSAALFRH